MIGRFCYSLEQRRDQKALAQLRGRIQLASRCPVDDLPSIGQDRHGLVIHHTLHVAPVLVGGVERQAAHGVFRIEVILELEGDRFGTAHQRPRSYKRSNSRYVTAAPG
jgi:hypothetical protein